MKFKSYLLYDGVGIVKPSRFTDSIDVPLNGEEKVDSKSLKRDDRAPLDFGNVNREDTNPSNQKYYIVVREWVIDRFLWIYVVGGSSTPYSKEVYDSDSNKKIDNPRDKDKIELNQQFFCLCDLDKRTDDACLLYISPGDSVRFFERYLAKKTQINLSVKQRIVDEKEFIDRIKTVKQIKLVGERDVIEPHLRSLDMLPQKPDGWGLGMPYKHLLVMNYRSEPVTKKFKRIFLKKCKSPALRKKKNALICVGKDDNDIETIYNMDTLSESILLEDEKDENGMFDPEAVKQKIVQDLDREP